VSPDEEEIVPAVRADNLYKIFGKRSDRALKMLSEGASTDEAKALGVTPAVVDVSFDVEPGEIFVVMGLSGSGKSTLIRMLNGLLEPTGGHVEIDGSDITTLRPKELRAVRQKKISMVFQHFALFPHRTVLDNAAYGLEVQGFDPAERRKRAQRALGMVGLEGWETNLPEQLSGGMQQRVGLARALASESEIMLMDEAFSALDPLIRRDMQTQLLELQSQLGKTIVFITHDLNEAMRLGDRIAVMRSGRIVQIGTAEEILNDPANDYVAQFVQDVDRTRVLTATSVMEQPLAIVAANAGPRAALRTMRENQAGAAFVLDRERRLVGAVRGDPVAEAVRKGEDKLDGLIEEELQTVSPDTAVADLFAPAAESPLPLAVIDDRNRLLGVIPRVTLLAALGNVSSHDTSSVSVSAMEVEADDLRGTAADDDGEEEAAGVDS
jgi:glycine betaine/proline transport system ATP-binding protein